MIETITLYDRIGEHRVCSFTIRDDDLNKSRADFAESALYLPRVVLTSGGRVLTDEFDKRAAELMDRLGLPYD